jgi:hypothetical protein
MADLVTDPVGQSMETAGNAGGSGDVAPQQNPLQSSQDSDTQSPPAGSNTEGPPRVKGTLNDRRKEILAKNPKARLKATPDMQAEYYQVVTRFLLMLHDPRQSKGDPKTGKKLPSPMDAAIMQMNNRKLSVPQAVGRTTAQLLFILHNSVKVQKAKVNPNVWFRAADECVIATYLLGHARGIWEGVPKYKPFRPHTQPGKKYPFDDVEKKLILQAKIEAVRWFGNLMQKSGQISPAMQQKAQQYWDSQIKQEIASGKVTDDHVAQMMKDPKVQQSLQGFGNQPSNNNASTASSQTDDSGGQGQPPAQGQQGGQAPAPAPPPAPAPAPPAGGGMAPPQNPQGGQ